MSNAESAEVASPALLVVHASLQAGCVSLDPDTTALLCGPLQAGGKGVEVMLGPQGVCTLLAALGESTVGVLGDELWVVGTLDTLGGAM